MPRPNRHNQRRPRNRILDNPSIQPEHLQQHPLSQNLNRRPLRHDPPIPHGHDVVRIPSSQVQVMQHHDNRPPHGNMQLLHQIQHINLMSKIQIGGRLVQQQQISPLSKSHGDPSPLPLPPGQLVNSPLSQIQNPGHSQRGINSSSVIRRPLPIPGLMRMPPPSHQISHSQPLRSRRSLRQHPQNPGNIPSGHRIDLPAVQQHRTGPSRQQPPQRLQQSRLATPVGPDHRGNRATDDRQIERVDDLPFPVAHAQRRSLKTHTHTRASRRLRISRNIR
ncbi:hypothetical protein SAMN04488074_109145 [Lentzea albidocapillata subsp. violacea]|uniref:Uncharacterized protein n=1 Tax=Lentzea albidocapillata subsp. violacea TaxID=128104 RepID=A0A1G9HRB0_9PSEU|nr:hypothetical protein SAMN04488074_109145 [Lentzea albidocapillata subsp. violacea]